MNKVYQSKSSVIRFDLFKIYVDFDLSIILIQVLWGQMFPRSDLVYGVLSLFNVSGMWWSFLSLYISSPDQNGLQCTGNIFKCTS